MQSRHRDLLNIVRSVDGLEVIEHYTTNGRAEVNLRAPNGRSRKFFLSLRSGTLRNDINTKKAIERFALENIPANPVIPASPEKVRSLKAVSTNPQTNGAKRPTLTVPKIVDVMQESIKPQAAVSERALTNIEFFQLCRWVGDADLTDYCDADAAGAAASTQFGVFINADIIREVLTLLKKDEPAGWAAVLDPITVLADQLAAIMTDLNIKPTPDFIKLARQLHKD